MGRYIDEILQPDEKVLFTTKIHWIIYWPAILAWIAAIGLFALLGPFAGTAIVLLPLSGICALIGLYFTIRAWFRRWTSETDVTTMRVVHKEGFVQRETFEMNLDRVESVDVSQSIGGRMLGYGNVTIVGVGDSERTIQMIGSPIQFRNHITAR